VRAARNRIITVNESGDYLSDSFTGQICTSKGIHHIPMRAPLSQEAELRGRLAAFGVE
jgi:hypothetical protein